ncbi:OVARIAN TUMOR DOMAIN-containing deubiquitinating enzyme 3 isoform X3 [Daucus carota subsp. sativus]|nr:PREDICTED: OTU domain-containing protein At3g57810 isoform X3 [Daucus carota subsp. sativus]
MKKVERYSVKKVTGDGRCLFRALVKGMAIHKGLSLNSREETENADELRTAVKEVICGKDNERTEYAEALMAITVEESLKRYCQRIGKSDFWGGESELLGWGGMEMRERVQILHGKCCKVLSKLCHQPIIVYIPAHEHAKGGYGSGFIPIAEYGVDYSKASWTGKAKKAVRLLYSGKNHYDLLV